jgi:hypothetical protein
MSTKTIDLKNDSVLAGIIADRSAKIFEERYPNLLACFDVGSVFSAIAASFRLDGGPTGDDFTVPNVVAATEEAFKTLITRGALNQFQRVSSPIPAAAQRELDELFGTDEADTAAQEEADQISEHNAQVAECAKDWRSLPTSDFKRKWNTPERQGIVQEAWAQLENQDRAIADGYKNQRESREREAHAAFGTTPLSPRNF